MRPRILLLLAVVAGLVAVPIATGATASRSHAVQLTLHMASIGQFSGNGVIFAGEVVGRPTGRSALVLRNTISSSSGSGTAVLYAKRGTLRVTTKNEFQQQPDGSIRVPGSFKIVDGTGRYRNATGRGTFTRSLPANSTIFEIKLKGHANY
jgi:hypothetical protein